MRLWLIAVGAGLGAAGANAAGPLARALQTAPKQQPAPRSFGLRLVQQPDTDLAPVHHNGMIGETGIGPNVRLGLGLFNARRNRLNSLEPKPEVRDKPSRKVGLSLNLRF